MDAARRRSGEQSRRVGADSGVIARADARGRSRGRRTAAEGHSSRGRRRGARNGETRPHRRAARRCNARPLANQRGTGLSGASRTVLPCGSLRRGTPSSRRLPASVAGRQGRMKTVGVAWGRAIAIQGHRLEDAVAISVLASMVVLAALEITSRIVAGGSVPGSIVLVQHLTLWITVIGAAIAARSDRLLALATPQLLPVHW